MRRPVLDPTAFPEAWPDLQVRSVPPQMRGYRRTTERYSYPASLFEQLPRLPSPMERLVEPGDATTTSRNAHFVPRFANAFRINCDLQASARNPRPHVRFFDAQARKRTPDRPSPPAKVTRSQDDIERPLSARSLYGCSWANVRLISSRLALVNATPPPWTCAAIPDAFRPTREL